MLTQNMYPLFTEALKGERPLFIAVGVGEPAWDDTPPDSDSGGTRLINEVERKAATPGAVAYFDPDGNVVLEATPRLQIAVTFDDDQAVGTLRECGLFGGAATAAPNTGDLLAYYIHAKVEKTTGTTLTRRLVIDLTPQGLEPGRLATRYLGNVCQRELHDLDNEKPQCQIDEIARDRRYFFDTVPQARAMGYDVCGHCMVGSTR